MLLSSAFKATAYKGFLLKGHLKHTERQAGDVEKAEFRKARHAESASLQVCSLHVSHTALKVLENVRGPVQSHLSNAFSLRWVIL